MFHSNKKHFEKGAKFEALYPLFEAAESFLFSTSEVSKGRVQVRDSLDTKRYMGLVVAALIPCTLFGIFNAGYQAHIASGLDLAIGSVLVAGLKICLPIILVSYAVGGFWEVIFAVVRKHEINEGFLVTGLLFPLTLPPTIPLWQVALGISFGVVIGKEIFGGTGRNFLNPALTARAFLYFTFPAKMSGEVWTAIVNGKDAVVDSFSGATPLSVAVGSTGPVDQALVSAGFTLKSMFLGFMPGSLGETSVLCALIGAAILIVTGVGSWRTMLGGVLGLVGTVLLFNLFAGDAAAPYLLLGPVWHLVIGGFAFGMVFMATDPVSSPDLEESKWVYGVLIGAVTAIIRIINPAYPEGIMLAILLMNVFAPLIDHVILESKLKKRISNVL